MKKKITLKLAIFGILLIGVGLFLMFYPKKTEEKKKPTSSSSNKETTMLGDLLTTKEINFYQQNVGKLKDNLQSYEFQYVYPEDSIGNNVITETLNEEKKTKLIEFLETVTPVESLPGELGWPPFSEAIHILDNQNKVMSIYPCINSFCFVVYQENKFTGFVFDSEKDIFQFVKEEQIEN